ncbi:MAG: hypothetical protein KDB88_13125, partial [Flavobacteriales bacterium]|nr:hypothetical protein [Flavobacteriales bacterium]
SGGTMLELARERSLDHIVIPGGNPPRTMLAYSLVQQFVLLKHFGIIATDLGPVIARSAETLLKNKPSVQDAAKQLADVLHGKRTVIYSEASTEGVSIRFRQQLNENSKELCWHHVIPEMNHNELVGWAGGSKDLAVVLFRHKQDQERSQVRMEINKEVFRRYTDHIHEVWSQGESAIERQLYLIHLGDWVSYYLAEKKGVDPIEIEVINMLKGKLAEVK